MSNQVYSNDEYRYDLANLGRACYQLETNQSVVDGGTIDIPLSETINEINDYITYNGSGQFTINLVGVYNVSLTCEWASNAVGSRDQYLFYPNNSGVQLGRYAHALVAANTQATQDTIVNSSATFLGKVGDTFTIKAGQTSGGALNLLGNPSETNVIITKIS